MEAWRLSASGASSFCVPLAARSCFVSARAGVASRRSQTNGKPAEKQDGDEHKSLVWEKPRGRRGIEGQGHSCSPPESYILLISADPAIMV